MNNNAHQSQRSYKPLGAGEDDVLSSKSPVQDAYGAKAGMLRRLQQAGFRVPEFVVSPASTTNALGLLGAPVAVRSSAGVEDGGDWSFAGQFCSYLNLGSLEEVDAAIRHCRESATSAPVVSYCRRNGLDPDNLHVDVIVQRMVQPELAGVAFSINPVTGLDEVVIEACEGLADRLLAGEQPALPTGHPLLERYRSEIERTVREIQQFLGAPQDVEFAIEGGTLYILQSRPITRIGFAGEPGEWTNADFRDGGVSSGVCSPLMWSLYDFVWERTLKESLQELKLFSEDFPAGRMFFGRPYWNVGAVKDCLARLPGFVERDFDNDLSIEITYSGSGRRTPVTLRGLWNALPTLLSLPRFFRRQAKFDTAFLSGGFESLLQKYERLQDDPVAAFRQLVENEFLLTESNYFRTIFATSLAKMDFTSSFSQTDYGSLVSALPALRHMLPVRAAQQLPARDDDSLAAIIDRYRHHYRMGLDLRFPRWDEDRQFVTEMLRELPRISGEGSDPRQAYETARAEALARIPKWKRPSFQRKLDRLRKFVWLREEMRDLSNQVYYLLRRYAIEIGRQRGIGDDVFFMTFAEIIADDRSQIADHRAVYDRFRNFKAPNEIGARYRAERQTLEGSSRLAGIGASPGVATGRAYIARNVEEALAMAPGGILICPFTDPGWTPVLDRAAAVVTETGGLLSHAAVICREYGIPAVLGIPEATERLPAGQMVVVHGAEGYVELID